MNSCKIETRCDMISSLGIVFKETNILLIQLFKIKGEDK